MLRTLRMYGRFAAGLPGFLRERVTIEQAEAAIRQGLASRETNFLRIARRGIYDNVDSPYRTLLDIAGCTYGDLESSVRAKGLDPTLEDLRRAGVYLTFEEYKGRTPLVRGGRAIEVHDHSFDNPLAARAYEGHTGGSTGAPSRVSTDLDTIRVQTPHMMIGRHIHGVLGLPMAIWKGVLPDPVGVEVILRTAIYGGRPERWFTPVTRDDFTPPLRFRIATRYIVWMSRLMGARFPSPEPLPLDRAIVLARWAADAVRREGGCQVVASSSLGIRVCAAAEEAGIDLTGARFFGGGEPFTAAKRAAFERVGAEYIPIYVSVDAGPMGMPCTAPIEENDQHLLEDNLALIQHPREVPGGATVDAFYFTSLRHLASRVLLNVESDDYGIVETRACGCPLDALGYHRHLRRIRSFGKLTGEGVTLVGSEMVRILEEVLPATFGGGPQDFQLVEEEGADGLTRLVLLVHPRLTIPREQDVVDVVLEAVGAGSVAGGLAQSYWRQAGTFGIRRQAPEWTSRGKLPSLRAGVSRPGDRG